ncbi:MAG: shikimate kinase [Oscillospiraceae bacterium]|nr:shikimate kinase [Candidatus Equicaccousia limihippi]
MNIILLGFMCAGKSSVAAELARLCGLAVFDTDKIIERQFNMSISQIFQTMGEDAFRQAELSAVKQALSGENRIIALGGGSLLNGETAELIKDKGIKIYLKISPQTVLLRDDGSRPLILNKGLLFIEKLLNEREKVYKNAADIVVNADDLSPQILAQKIIDRTKKGDYN